MKRAISYILFCLALLVCTITGSSMRIDTTTTMSWINVFPTDEQVASPETVLVYNENGLSGFFMEETGLNETPLVITTMSDASKHTPLPETAKKTVIKPVLEPQPVVYRANLAFTGDLMVHERQLEAAYRSASDTYTFSSFEDIAQYLQNADYTIGNLETTFAGKEAGYGTYPLFNTPDTFADAIMEAGFDFVSTANNHCFDKREKGLTRTLAMLDARGIAHTGTFATQEAQETVLVTDINGIRFTFLSYTYSTNGIPVPTDKPWLVNMLDEDLIRQQIEQAREAGAEVVIILPHMGIEYEETPSARYVNWARTMCMLGADAVMASHPHVLQPTEFFEVEEPDGTVRTCFIAYSMGNFISSQRTVPRDASAVFYLEYEKTDDGPVQLTNVSFVPTWVRFIDARGQYDIKVLSVYDALANSDINKTLRPQDITRLRAVHRDTTAKLLGEAVPLDAINPIYSLMP